MLWILFTTLLLAAPITKVDCWDKDWEKIESLIDEDWNLVESNPEKFDTEAASSTVGTSSSGLLSEQASFDSDSDESKEAEDVQAKFFLATSVYSSDISDFIDSKMQDLNAKSIAKQNLEHDVISHAEVLDNTASSDEITNTDDIAIADDNEISVIGPSEILISIENPKDIINKTIPDGVLTQTKLSDSLVGESPAHCMIPRKYLKMLLYVGASTLEAMSLIEIAHH